MENSSLLLSFLITVCNEHEELDRLLKQLLTAPYKYEIVILVDKSNTTQNVQDVINNYITVSNTVCKIIQSELNGDFGKFKTFGNSHCTGDWIFQIDADELLHPFLLEHLLTIITSYTDDVDVIQVPRINTVDGITEKHIQEWKWHISKNECVVSTIPLSEFTLDGSLVDRLKLVKESNEEFITYYEPLINFPDYQFRLYRNASYITWQGAVHERIVSSKSSTVGYFPPSCEYALYHPKSIERQVMQNNKYSQMISKK